MTYDCMLTAAYVRAAVFQAVFYLSRKSMFMRCENTTQSCVECPYSAYTVFIVSLRFIAITLLKLHCVLEQSGLDLNSVQLHI